MNIFSRLALNISAKLKETVDDLSFSPPAFIRRPFNQHSAKLIPGFSNSGDQQNSDTGNGSGQRATHLQLLRLCLKMGQYSEEKILIDNRKKKRVITNCKKNKVFVILRHQMILVIFLPSFHVLNKHSELSCQTIAYSEQD